jgi:hypothetical protein
MVRGPAQWTGAKVVKGISLRFAVGSLSLATGMGMARRGVDSA